MRHLSGGLRSAGLYLGIATLLGTLSCTGVLESGGPGGTGTNPAGSGNPDGSGSPGTGQQGDPGKIYPPGTNPGRGEMHRLNSTEYNATVADVLGTKLAPANINWRGGEIEGFDNVAAVLGVDVTQYGLYLDAAEALATDVFANPALKSKFVTCTTVDDKACVSTFVSNAGLKVFRRPLRDSEVTTYSNVYTAARGQMQDHDGSLKHVLWAMLASAEFLYRIELPKANAKRPLDGYELASRLSYFLWSSAPDDALLSAAASNALSTDQQVAATVDRMLKDGKSARFIESFAGQWLGARKVSSHPVAAERFPMWSQAVADSAMNEMYLYFQEFLQNPRPWTDFLKADINYVNASLAPIYGIQNVTSANLMQVTNTADERKGFMGLVGFLALSSMDRRTSPTLRGKWVLGNMLCTEAPAPPPNVPKLETGGKDLESGNIRKILEEHRVNQACASCHAIFDPFGLALEKYDAIGRFRTTYGDGSAIDASTELGGQKFEGLSGAADIVTAKPEFKTCFARKIFTYGLGRAPSNDDKLWIDKMAHDWETGGLTVRGLIDGFTHSEPFRNSGDVQ